MTFLNPAILWGLAAISIPIIIHIFNLKRTRKMEFSTLMFLKEIQQSKYKKIKLKQLLILLCRIAMIIFLVTAFAQPFETGYLGSAGEKAPSTVLIILDDSYSMQTRDVQGNYFENAKNKINELVNVLGENDEVYFSTVSNISKSNIPFLYKDLNELKDSLLKIKISDATKDLSEVLYFSNKILENSTNPNKEIFLFTDGQKNFISKDDNNFVNLNQINLNVITIGYRKGNNISLDTINTVTKIFEKNKNVRMKCIINNRNDFNASNKSIIINTDKKTNYREEKVIDIPSNSSLEVEFNFIPNVTGFVDGTIEIIQNEISDDEISSDNKRFFSFFIPEEINLLLVSSSNDDVKFIKIALSSSEELLKDSLNRKIKFFEVKQIGENELYREDLKTYNSVLISNKRNFNNAEADNIHNYLQNGGGVIIFPGHNSSIENYNDILLRKLEAALINSTFGNLTGDETYKFDELDFEHPILEGIYKQPSTPKNFITESPKIKFGLNLITERNAQSIIKLDNEKNFLAEYSVGRGKLIFYAVSSDMSYSDFPQKNIFSPIIVRSILYSSNKFLIKEAVTGRDYFLDLSALNLHSNIDTLEIYNTNFNSPYTKYATGFGDIINLKGHLNSSSNYSIMGSGKIIYEFPCNFNKKESDLEKASKEEIEETLKTKYNVNVNVIPGGEEISSSLINLRKGSGIWQYFLIIGVLFLALEFYLSKTLAK